MVRSLLRFRATHIKKLRLVLLVTEGMPIRSVQGGLNHAATKSHQDYVGDLIVAVAKPPCRLPSLKAMFFRVLRFLTSKADISARVSIRAVPQDEVIDFSNNDFLRLTRGWDSNF